MSPQCRRVVQPARTGLGVQLVCALPAFKSATHSPKARAPTPLPPLCPPHGNCWMRMQVCASALALLPCPARTWWSWSVLLALGLQSAICRRIRAPSPPVSSLPTCASAAVCSLHAPVTHQRHILLAALALRWYAPPVLVLLQTPQLRRAPCRRAPQAGPSCCWLQRRHRRGVDSAGLCLCLWCVHRAQRCEVGCCGTVVGVGVRGVWGVGCGVWGVGCACGGGRGCVI